MSEPGYFHRDRHAGILAPLFSIPSSASWGVGEICDLPRFARWTEQAGCDFVQLLPVNEMEEGQNSPYSAMSAMALDPVFIALRDVPEFAEAGGVQAMEAAPEIDRARQARAVDFRRVRAVKAQALRIAFGVFRDRHRGTGSERDRSFAAFAEREGWWLDEYVLFRALHDENQARYWREWPAALRDRDPRAIAGARERLAENLLYFAYLQWLADEQWQRARQSCGTVGIFGDFQFMVSGHSADVWARQHEFDIDASVGTPPDAFSEDGQDWGLPVYRWNVMATGNDEWLRQRIRRCVELYDGFRIDHLVGFYRTYVRERGRQAYFDPADEPAQLVQGERLMRLFIESGARIVAEDLGLVPDFVRESLARLRIPGLKVLRWERRWHEEGQPFRRPQEYPAVSVAISSTHDTEMLAGWWDAAGLEERRLCARILGVPQPEAIAEAPYSATTRDALLRVLFAAGSDFVIVPIQDVFGWRDRVNVPGVVNDENWTWRLPWDADTLRSQPEAQERAAFLRDLAHHTGRS
jgi:4-alpha-glucanotransferase